MRTGRLTYALTLVDRERVGCEAIPIGRVVDSNWRARGRRSRKRSRLWSSLLVVQPEPWTIEQAFSWISYYPHTIAITKPPAPPRVILVFASAMILVWLLARAS